MPQVQSADETAESLEESESILLAETQNHGIPLRLRALEQPQAPQAEAERRGQPRRAIDINFTGSPVEPLDCAGLFGSIYPRL